MTAVVGLTGGIACGKSTVAAFFGELGVPTVDADALSREVVAPGTEALAEIVESFGVDVLQPDGSLDRGALGALVFSDREARARLESITHPRIAQLGLERITEHAAAGRPLVLYEAALLVEKGLHERFPKLIVVTTTPELQLARLMRRDGLDEAAARARIDAQMPLGEKAALADFVIENVGDRAQTRASVVQTLRLLQSALGLEGARS